jgi:hypothetical protein
VSRAELSHRRRGVGRDLGIPGDRGPLAVTLLLLLVLGGQARGVCEAPGVAARAFSVAVSLAEEVECRAVARRVVPTRPGDLVEARVASRSAPLSQSVRSYAWPLPRAPSGRI